jgi:hypothetical protein
MVIDMNDAKLQTLDQVRAFLRGAATVVFSATANEHYEFAARTVRRFGHVRLKRTAKGVVLCFLGYVSGYSRQQFTRLVLRAGGCAPLVKRYRASRSSFARHYTAADVRLQAENDTLQALRSCSWLFSDGYDLP